MLVTDTNYPRIYDCDVVALYLVEAPGAPPQAINVQEHRIWPSTRFAHESELLPYARLLTEQQAESIKADLRKGGYAFY